MVYRHRSMLLFSHFGVPGHKVRCNQAHFWDRSWSVILSIVSHGFFFFVKSMQAGSPEVRYGAMVLAFSPVETNVCLWTYLLSSNDLGHLSAAREADILIFNSNWTH